ncbi:hypothetical protein AYI69_g1359 [Smittium culicis]|uniref:Uncharacterized protein n=1 Tax=Smittium culicis TaxID=133412 RepID=A0A1R1YQJ5_9FUNG|nr:hypothetical protein AYI69_g1359 [Smittium culicis]
MPSDKHAPSGHLGSAKQPTLQSFRLVQPLIPPPMDLDIPDSPESAQITFKEHFNYPTIEDGNVVSGPTGIYSHSAITPAGSECHTRHQKRKASSIEQ